MSPLLFESSLQYVEFHTTMMLGGFFVGFVLTVLFNNKS